MARTRQFVKGNGISTMQALSEELDAGRYVFMHGRVTHPRWVASMQYGCIRAMLNRKAFSFALQNPQHASNQQ